MTEARSSKALVVIPTYDELASIGDVITGVLAATDEADILVVDDASPDGTGALVEELAADEPRLNVAHRPGKQGLGSAYRQGFRWGLDRGYSTFVEMDADLSHDPAHLPALLAATDRVDVVIGSRYIPGGRTVNWPRRRRLLSWLGNRYVQLATGVPVRDATSGYRAYRRAVLEEIAVGSLRSEGYSFQLEAVLRAWRAGFVIEEVPIRFVERRSGASKISRAIVLEAMWRVLAWAFQTRLQRRAHHPRSIGTPADVG